MKQTLTKLKLHKHPNGISLECRVSPKSGKNAIKGIKDGVLQIALKAPPIEGRANEELVKFISKTLSVPRSNVSIIKGEHSRNKVVFITGIGEDVIDSRFTIHDSRR